MSELASSFYMIDEADEYVELGKGKLEFHENDPDYWMSLVVPGEGDTEIGVCIGLIDLIRIVNAAKTRGIEPELFA